MKVKNVKRNLRIYLNIKWIIRIMKRITLINIFIIDTLGLFLFYPYYNKIVD